MKELIILKQKGLWKFPSQAERATGKRCEGKIHLLLSSLLLTTNRGNKKLDIQRNNSLNVEISFNEI